MKKLITAFAFTLICCISWFAWQSAPVAAAGYPDLVVTNFSWDNKSEVVPGTTVTFSVTVKNEGTAAIQEHSQPFNVSFWVQKPEQSTEVMLTETAMYYEGLLPGQSVTLMSDEWIATTGDYMVVAKVNSTGTVTESKTNNNATQANLRVATKKLAPTCKDVQALLEAGDITNLIFSDDFNSISTVDINDSGKLGYKWYVDRPYGAVTLTQQDYTVKNGIMTVHNEIPTYNYGLGTYHPENRVGFTYNMGYMEIRLRIPRPRENTTGETGVPAIWALPDTKLTNQSTHWVELDWLEYWGITKSRPEGYYTVCLHEQYGNPVHTWYKNSNYSYRGLGDGEWHTMGWLWQKGVFITYLDGKETMRITYGEGEDPTPFHTVVKGEFYDGAFAQMDKQNMPIIIGGSKDNPLELDYVRVWSNTNAEFIPDKSATEFIQAYTKNNDDSPIITVNEDNYTYILHGENEWLKLNDVSQKYVNRVLAVYNQPPFPELLKKAHAVQDTVNDRQLTESATVFISYYATDTDRVPITKIRANNYHYILYGKNEWNNADTALRDRINQLLADNGQPTFQKLLDKAQAIEKEIATGNHSYAYSHTVKTTMAKNGYKAYTCTTCGLEAKGETIYRPYSFKLSKTSYTYNGKRQVPTVTIKDYAGKIIPAKYYTVKLATGCKNAGTQKLLVTMSGLYTGSKTVSYKINPIRSDTCTFKVTTPTLIYNGNARLPSVVVKNTNGTTLTKNTHYTVKRVTGCTGAGTHKILIAMKGNYGGSKTLTFKITPVSASKCTVTASDFTYTGAAKTPAVTVKNAHGTILVKGKDYTVSRVTGCKTIGTHKLKITMKGNYSGSKTVTFKIRPLKSTITGLRTTSRSVKITLKQLSSTQASGYQVQHSASSKFTNVITKTMTGYKTTTCTISLPTTKRTYHVRVRTYKTVNGVRYYSVWNTYYYQKTT